MKYLMAISKIPSYFLGKANLKTVNFMSEPITLGDILMPVEPVSPPYGIAMIIRKTARLLINLALLTAIFALPTWWYLARPNIDKNIIITLTVALAILWLIVAYRNQAVEHSQNAQRRNLHFLLANDRYGFMRDLRLDTKTVIIDGSNIYHFGRANGLDAQPLGELAHQLRAEGHRIVCFFDANIYFTLNEHGAFPNDHIHAPGLLKNIFGLEYDEIYVVPSGVQADKYVLDSLKHLPISFAVTNDQYRDYAKEYTSVMKDALWRKGVVLTKNGIKLR